MPTVSVIIPTLNEAGQLPGLLDYLHRISDRQVVDLIVVDGGSTDHTVAWARKRGVRVLVSDRPGRARQMNLGAAQARGDVLQFIHADTRPPESNFQDIRSAIHDGYDLGCFTYRFDSSHPLLRINGWFTRLDRLWCRGGDQAIFIRRDLFQRLGGYPDHWQIMEEYDLLQRARQQGRFIIVRKDSLVSARKYKDRPYLRVQLANLIVFQMFRLGYSQRKLLDTYRNLLG